MQAPNPWITPSRPYLMYTRDADGCVHGTSDMEEYLRGLDSGAYCLADTQVGGARVSTVFTGMDLGYPFSPDPLIFETMVFLPGDDPADRPRWLYASEAEARDGHQDVVRDLKRATRSSGVLHDPEKLRQRLSWRPAERES